MKKWRKNKKPVINEYILVETEEIAAVIWRCSANMDFWKIVQNSQENTCTEVTF